MIRPYPAAIAARVGQVLEKLGLIERDSNGRAAA
jgi:hypothetical protein